LICYYGVSRYLWLLGWALGTEFATGFSWRRDRPYPQLVHHQSVRSEKVDVTLNGVRYLYADFGHDHRPPPLASINRTASRLTKMGAWNCSPHPRGVTLR